MHLNPKLGICPVCHNESGDILLEQTPAGNIKLHKEKDNERHRLSPNPCSECEERLKDMVALIPLSTAPTGDTVTTAQFHQNRTGNEIAWLKVEAFARLFGSEKIPKGHVAACDPEMITQLKQLQANIPEEDTQ